MRSLLLLAMGACLVTAAPVYVGVIAFNELIPSAPGAPGVNVFDIQNFTGAYSFPPDLPVVSDLTILSASLQLYQGATLYDTLLLGDIGPGPLLNLAGDPLAQVAGDLSFTAARLVGTLSFTSLLLDTGGTVDILPFLDVVFAPGSGPSFNFGDGVAIRVETVTSSAVPEPVPGWMLLAGMAVLAAHRRWRRTARLGLPLAAVALAVSASAQNLVTLTPTTTPSAGLPGVTLMSVTGSGFPAGTDVTRTTVTLTPVTSGPAMTAATQNLTLVVGNTCIVYFRFNGPNVTAPTDYHVWVAGPSYVTRAPARMTVRPAPTASILPTTVSAGSSPLVLISGLNTTFVNGSTRANFGTGISTGGGAPGAFGLVTVTSPASATAQLAIAANSPIGQRTVTIVTGAQQLTVNFTVADPTNNRPRITSAPVATANAQQPYTYDVNATDPDGDPIAYSLNTFPAGMTINGTTGVISWTPTEQGSFNVTVEAADGRGGRDTQSFPVVVAGVTTNEPLLKFSFKKPPQAGAALSPVVIDLDKDGIGDIVFGGVGPSQLSLYAVDGRTGQKKWSVDGGYNLFSSGTEMTAGDLDGDGFPEILVIVDAPSSPRTQIRCYNHDGTVKWQSNVVDGARVTSSNGTMRLVLANVVGDSKPEIIFGHLGRTNDLPAGQFSERLVSIFNNQGAPLTATRIGRFSGGLDTITVADLNLDGSAEILYGGAAVSGQGTLLWLYDQVTQVLDAAVANLDADPFPEIVYLDRFFNLYCAEHTGAKKWGPVKVPVTGSLGDFGLPVIGDANGDGKPEILVALGKAIQIFNTDGTLQRTIPLSYEGVGGNPTLFDLNGDGKPEIVYHSGRGPFDVPSQFLYGALFVFDGPTGVELFSAAASRTSSAQLVTPLIADVDGDGAAEIVVGGADQGGILRVFKAKSGNWAPARPVANQQEYSVTNVNDNGTIPAAPPANWTVPGLNSFRVYTKPASGSF